MKWQKLSISEGTEDAQSSRPADVFILNLNTNHQGDHQSSRASGPVEAAASTGGGDARKLPTKPLNTATATLQNHETEN